MFVNDKNNMLHTCTYYYTNCMRTAHMHKYTLATSIQTAHMHKHI